MKNTNCFTRIGHFIIIGLFSLLTHGLLLLNDGVYWDGWLIYTALIEKNWTVLNLWFTESGGLPLTLYLHWFLGYFPGVVFGYKLIAFLSITLSGILVYLVCDKLRIFTCKESLLIVLLSLSYPAFQVSIGLITLPYLVFYCLFLLACLFAVKSEEVKGIPSHYFMRAFSLILFALSFSINSLLVFYFGFFFILVHYIQRKWNLSSFKDVFTKILPRRLDYAILPFLYWVIIKFFFPAHGLYANYNQISFSPLRIIYIYIIFAKNAVYAQLNEALVGLINMPVLLLLGLLAAYCAYVIFSLNDKVLFGQKLKPYSLLFCGFMLLLLGIFPYAVVGKSPSIHGWGTRHALLVVLPMAIVIVNFGHMLFGNKKGSISKIGFSFLVIFVLAFSISTITYYISWQARWVKDRSIMTNLADFDKEKDISILWINDQFPLGGENNYQFYEWSSMFKTVWGDESHIGLDSKNHRSGFPVDYGCFFNKRYNLSNFDPDGSQAELTIRRGIPHSELGLSMWYLYYKHFRKNRLATFLSGITDIEIQPIPLPN